MVLSFENLIVVLHRPHDVRNIGAVVRAMKNMGASRLRLVSPAPFVFADLLGIAHRSEDVLERMELFGDLGAALADVTYVVGTSEHRHAGRPMHTDPRALAPAILARAAQGPVALLFGPEDNGLDLADLDRCHAIVTLPSDPAYPSLNLAQAAMLLLYELRLAAVDPLPPTPLREAAPAGELEGCLALVDSMLRSIDFYKSGDGAATMRALRALLLRAEPDRRELALIGAIAREVVKRG